MVSLRFRQSRPAGLGRSEGSWGSSGAGHPRADPRVSMDPESLERPSCSERRGQDLDIVVPHRCPSPLPCGQEETPKTPCPRGPGLGSTLPPLPALGTEPVLWPVAQSGAVGPPTGLPCPAGRQAAQGTRVGPQAGPWGQARAGPRVPVTHTPPKLCPAWPYLFLISGLPGRLAVRPLASGALSTASPELGAGPATPFGPPG